MTGKHIWANIVHSEHVLIWEWNLNCTNVNNESVSYSRALILLLGKFRVQIIQVAAASFTLQVNVCHCCRLNWKSHSAIADKYQSGFTASHCTETTQLKSSVIWRLLETQSFSLSSIWSHCCLWYCWSWHFKSKVSWFSWFNRTAFNWLSTFDPVKPLRSSGSDLLTVPKIRCECAKSVFSYCAPVLWSMQP